jgi:hypothetical protein
MQNVVADSFYQGQVTFTCFFQTTRERLPGLVSRSIDGQQLPAAKTTPFNFLT